MNAREEASKSFQKLHAKAFGYDYKNIGCESASRFVNLIIEAVKEDIKEEYRIKIIDAQTSREPELIQGYTAEQWQEIIDDGYLCEFFSDSNHICAPLKDVDLKGECFTTEFGGIYHECRPAQIKGVMRPIWVEPVDKEAGCIFFIENTVINGEGLTWPYSYTDIQPTSYIEL